MKKVAIYVRVSTQEQSLEGYSIQAQKEKLISYCKVKDWLVKDVYIDGGYSGSNMNRPALEKLLGDIKGIDIVLVYKLDRLSRSQKDTLYLIEDQFLKHGVDFVSITENFDTTSPFGRAMIGILSVFAQLERENIKERTKMGRIERAKKGLWVGTPNPPIGYDIIDSTLILNEYEAMQVRDVFDLYIKGYGIQRIQNHFIAKGQTTRYGDWSSTSTHAIVRIITNRTYIGETKYAGKWYKGIHTPIIDIETFEKANRLYEQRKEKPRARKHFLSGLLFCKECGGKYVPDTGSGKTYYVCKHRKLAYKLGTKCQNPIFRVEALEEQAVKKIKKLLGNKEKLVSKHYAKHEIKPASNTDGIRARKNDIDKQIGKLMDLYQLDTIPFDEISARIEKLHTEKKALEAELSKEQIQPEQIDIGEIADMLEDFDAVWEELEVEQKKEIAGLILGQTISVSERGI